MLNVGSFPYRSRDLTVDIELLKNAKFHGGFKKLIPFLHLFQILYELEKKSSLVTRALSAKSCTRDTDSLHSCTRLNLVQEMACLNHSCKIWPRKHSYPNLIPIILYSSTGASLVYLMDSRMDSSINYLANSTTSNLVDVGTFINNMVDVSIQESMILDFTVVSHEIV